jgi:hypothetical protein
MVIRGLQREPAIGIGLGGMGVAWLHLPEAAPERLHILGLGEVERLPVLVLARPVSAPELADLRLSDGFPRLVDDPALDFPRLTRLGPGGGEKEQRRQTGRRPQTHASHRVTSEGLGGTETDT